MEAWMQRNIADVVALRKAIREGKLEILGGGLHDAMLPLFPTSLQDLQLQQHYALVERIFQTEPVGYFNTSMAWEIGLTETLAKNGFRYTLVPEKNLQESLGIATRVTGWFTVEDRDSVMRLLPVAEDLSEAFLSDPGDLKKWEPFNHSPNTWTAVLSAPMTDIQAMESFFERLEKNLETAPLQFWTLSHSLEEPSQGKVNLMSGLGKDTGLPTGTRSCRELLLRRPEADLLHKSLLMANSHATSLLRGSELRSIQTKLLPLMSPVYYADLYGGLGVRSPEIRWMANRQFVTVEREIEKLANQDGRRVEISDFLRNGNRQILVNNSNIQFLMEQQVGASLRSLFYKPSKVNLITSSLQNGDVPRAFVDFLLSPSMQSVKQFHSALNDGLGILNAPYDYQIERDGETLGILLRSEQMTELDGVPHVLHLEKKYALQPQNSALDISYTISNGTFVDFDGYFGTELNLGIRKAHANRAYRLLIDGKKIPFRDSLPLLHPSASSILLKDGLLSYAFRLQTDSPVKVSVDWILGSNRTAAPTEIQGIRIFLFWNLKMRGREMQTMNIRMEFSKRGIFL